MKLHDFMTDTAICGDEFLAPSWLPWRVVARLYDGDADLLNDDERALACKLIGSDVLPDGPPTELVGAIGRRAGKSRPRSGTSFHHNSRKRLRGNPANPFRPAELNQAWMTLIVNALEAMEGSGRLEITVNHVSERVAVTLSDTGPGIRGSALGSVRSRVF